jgi:GNAT superfamily N-acetyltransferase
MPLSFLEMTATEDLARYEHLVGAEMEPSDFLEGAELGAMLAAGTARAWWVEANGVPVGWSCVMVPSPHHPDADSIHLLGSAVFRAFRGRGYGTAIAAWRAAQYADRPLTASVLPGNTPSERMLARNGFVPGLPQGPWITWHRPRPLALGQKGMVLVRAAEAHDWPAASELRRALTAQGYTAVLAMGAPQEGGAILRGLWPDPAAFHTLLDVQAPRVPWPISG